MKTSQDPRHKMRQATIRHLFTYSFRRTPPSNMQAQDIIQNLEGIDSVIQRIAPEFPIGKIHKVDLAILRLAVYEIIVKKSVPNKVTVDEAIELAKEFGGDSSPAFINGALGKLLRDNIDKSEKTADDRK